MGESQDRVPSLCQLTLAFVEANFESTKPERIPSPVVLQLLDYLMERRKSGSRTLTNKNITRFFLPEIQCLDLSNFWMDDLPFQNFPCQDLVSLDLTGCLQIGDGCVESLATNCPGLQFLFMDMCNNVTDHGCGFIAKMKNLKELAIRCLKITDGGIIEIADGLPQLSSLFLSTSEALTSSSLVYLSAKMKNLQKFKITCCTKINDATMSQMAEGFSKLKSLKIHQNNFMRAPQFGTTFIYFFFSHVM
eukprot:TRINITY_DN4189_c0_g1_i2.p1 TRINITY_DN4189_c0_g1~~TRINITY_DN4189_c0_g1_i2.p1  ORF type:complete len:248 (+),score=42.69 TRINITY_DN4189_c0_g1_i2:11-754(+)